MSDLDPSGGADTKPFLCAVCNEAFTHRENLVVHCAAHTGGKWLQNEEGRVKVERDVDPGNIGNTKDGNGEKYTGNIMGNLLEDRLKFETRQDEDLDDDDLHNVGKSKGKSLDLSFECDQCDMTFDTQDGAIAHLEIHDRKDLLCCSVCKLVLAQDEKQDEKQDGDDTGEIQCAHCFLNRAHSVKRPKKQKPRKNRKPVKKVGTSDREGCTNITLNVKSENNSKKRKERSKKKSEILYKDKNGNGHEKKELLKCNFCSKKFVSPENLEKHVEKRHCLAATKCNVCGRAFNRSAYLKQHMLIHTGEKPVKCPMCDRTFRQKPELTRHMRAHTGEKPYKCTECSEAYTERLYLRRHMINAHNIGSKPFLCSQCPQRFLRKYDLSAHFMTHTGEKPFACDQCGETFRQRFLLKRHMFTHSGLDTAQTPSPPKEKCQCTLCGKILIDKDGLRKHMRRHRGEEEVHCEICGKKFCTRGTLKRHQNVHSGLKPFECPDCGKKFTQKINLMNHQTKACPVGLNGSKIQDISEELEEEIEPELGQELEHGDGGNTLNFPGLDAQGSVT